MPEPVSTVDANGEMDVRAKEVLQNTEPEEDDSKAVERERGAKGALSLLAVIIHLRVSSMSLIHGKLFQVY